MSEISATPSHPKGKAGGARPGAGRHKKPHTVLRKTSAEQVLADVDEKRMWLEALTMYEDLKDAFQVKKVGGSEFLVAMDPAYLCKAMQIRVDALKYLTDRRDGKAAQGIDLQGKDGQPPTIRVLIETVGVS